MNLQFTSCEKQFWLRTPQLVRLCNIDGNCLGTGYDYPDLPGLGNNNEKLGLPERLSTGIQFRFRNLFHEKNSVNRILIC